MRGSFRLGAEKVVQFALRSTHPVKVVTTEVVPNQGLEAMLLVNELEQFPCEAGGLAHHGDVPDAVAEHAEVVKVVAVHEGEDGVSKTPERRSNDNRNISNSNNNSDGSTNPFK